MKVELNIEANQMGETVVSMFQNLSVEKKNEIAADMVSKWLNLPYDAERLIAENKAIEELQKEFPNDRDYRDSYAVRRDYRFNRKMEKFKSVREQFLADVTKEVVELVHQQIVVQIQQDEGIKKIMEATMEEIKQNFPKFAHDAIVAYFCTNMASLAQGMVAALATSSSASQLATNVQQQLSNIHASQS